MISDFLRPTVQSQTGYIIWVDFFYLLMTYIEATLKKIISKTLFSVLLTGLGALLLVVCALSGSATSVSDDTEETFAEELFIKPLPTGHLYSYFQFTTLWNEPPAQCEY